jgi:hypothetical protein
MISCPTFTTFTMLPEKTMRYTQTLCGPLLRCTHTHTTTHRTHTVDTAMTATVLIAALATVAVSASASDILIVDFTGKNKATTHTCVRASQRQRDVCMMVHCEHTFALCHATLVALARTHRLPPTRATHAPPLSRVLCPSLHCCLIITIASSLTHAVRCPVLHACIGACQPS